MELQFSSLPTWIDVFDFAAECALGTTSDTPIFVDVGGGNGQQCASLQQRYPTIQGRIILQDRPRILANAITGPGVERMEHDFFTEQPVKGIATNLVPDIYRSLTALQALERTTSDKSSTTTTTNRVCAFSGRIYQR